MIEVVHKRDINPVDRNLDFDEFDLLYKQGIHRNDDYKLRYKLDSLVEEILKEDRIRNRAIEQAKKIHNKYMIENGLQ